jgi:glycosyltransferase involved in cell wall biosynthesis
VAVVAEVAVRWGPTLKPLKVLVLTKYGRLGASSRLRFLQYLPDLQKFGLQLSVQSLISDECLRQRYETGRYGLKALVGAYAGRLLAMRCRHDFDLLWIEKEALPWVPFWLESAMLRGVPYVLDLDDAIFHNYDRHNSGWVRWLLGNRLDRIMAEAALVVVGNNYLGKRAHEAQAQWVQVLPTAIDLDRYNVKPTRTILVPGLERLPRIVWIGSPSTVSYLNLIREPLQKLAKKVPFVLRLIGCEVINLPGVQMEFKLWSEATEVVDINQCDVGVMPLLDSPWEQGKCGYKLIQYMACGLPVVASHVGVNPEMIQDGENGFLARTSEEWGVALATLLADERLRTIMGLAGRERVERSFSIQITGPHLEKWLRSAANVALKQCVD